MTQKKKFFRIIKLLLAILTRAESLAQEEGMSQELWRLKQAWGNLELLNGQPDRESKGVAK